jgi:aspartate aminotransferase
VAVSATLAINETVERARRDGRPVLALGFGEAGLPVHPALKERLATAAGSNAYGPVAGLPSLRTAAAGYWTRRQLPTGPDQVIVGPGSKPLLYALLHAIGGDVALPRPSWVSYAAQAALLAQRAHLVPTAPGQGGVPDPRALAAAADRARSRGHPLRSVLLTLPDNPTGTLASREQVASVVAVARAHDLVIVSDEIYRDLLHDPEQAFVSPAELAPERTVITTGLSKSLALGGWRLGVLRLPGSELGERLGQRVLHVASELWSSAPHPVQQVAAWAYDEPDLLRLHLEASRRLHACVAAAVAEVFRAAGATLDRPQGGFYVYPDLGAHRELLRERWGIADGPALAATLLDRLDIATLPGAAFGDDHAALRLRVATSLLYGPDDLRRQTALVDDDPLALPWIRDGLGQLARALGRLTG